MNSELISAISHLPHVQQNNCLLINASCSQVLKLLPKRSIQLLLTDPPYGNNYRTSHRRKTDKLRADIVNNEQLPTQLISDVLMAFHELSTSRSAAYVFSDVDHITDIRKLMIANSYQLGCSLIWLKNNWTAGNVRGSDYGNRIEYLTYGRRSKHKLNGSRDHNVLYFNRVHGMSMIHSTEKPVDLLEYIIRKSSQPGDIVLDPFAGSGSTGLAAILTGRQAILVELDKNRYNVMVNRLNQLSFADIGSQLRQPDVDVRQLEMAL